MNCALLKMGKREGKLIAVQCLSQRNICKTTASKKSANDIATVHIREQQSKLYTNTDYIFNLLRRNQSVFLEFYNQGVFKA